LKPVEFQQHFCSQNHSVDSGKKPMKFLLIFETIPLEICQIQQNVTCVFYRNRQNQWNSASVDASQIESLFYLSELMAPRGQETQTLPKSPISFNILADQLQEQ
jgi:hypothetical protein